VAVVTSDVKFTGVSLSPADSELLSQRKLSATEIARLLRCPPHLIGAEGGGTMTYSNVEQEGANFLRFSLQPHLTIVEQAISNDPDLSGPAEFVEFLVDAFLRADTATRYAAYETGIRAGFLLPNDARQRENLPPLPMAPPTAAPNPPTES
jgi:HK97 family phage portal protein